MIQLNMPAPSERQRLFMTDDHRYIIFGGARGGGKSWALRWKAILMCLHYNGIKILIMRKTYPELEGNHITPLKAILNGVATYNGTEHKFQFPNGSFIKFTFCSRDDDLTRIQGHEYDIIMIDEATNMTEFQIKAINACVRGVNNFPKRLYMTCNPGGPGHGYIKRLKEGVFKPEENPDEFKFIQSLVTDNKALMAEQPEYIKQLMALPPKLRSAWLEGNWSVYSGAVFEEYRDDPDHYEDRKWTHIIPAMAEIPRGWTIYRSFDWGYSKPFSCAWWAVDYDGVIYRILEFYGCKENEENEGVKWIDDKIFSEIARIEREHPYLAGKSIKGVADPAIWDASGTGLSTADVAAKHKVYFDKAKNDRIPGWMQCHYRMAFDENGYPMMYVFNNCKAFMRTIPTLCYSETHPEDLDTDQEDHVADEFRYFCMSRPIKPRMVNEVRKPAFDPLNQYKGDNQ